MLLVVLSFPGLKGSCQYVMHSKLWMSSQNLGYPASRRIGRTCCLASSVHLGQVLELCPCFGFGLV